MAKKKEEPLYLSLLRVTPTIKLESYRNLFSLFTDAIRSCEKRTYDRAAINIISNPLFNQISPYEIFNYLDAKGWCFGNVRSVWIEGPGNGNNEREALLLRKNKNKLGFHFYSVRQEDPAMMVGRENLGLLQSSLKEIGVFENSVTYDKHENNAFFTLLSPCYATLNEYDHLTPHLQLESSPFYQTLLKRENKEALEQKLQNNARVEAIFSLRLMLLMAKVSPPINSTNPDDLPSKAIQHKGMKHAPQPKPIVLNQKFHTAFAQVKTADDLRRFFGMPEQAELDARPIISEIDRIRSQQSLIPKDVPQEAREGIINTVQKTENIPTIYFDRSFHDVAQELIKKMPVKEMTHLLASTDIMFDKLWIEGPYIDPTLPAPETQKDPFIPRVGAVIERTETGLTISSLQTARNYKTLFTDQLYAVKKPLLVPATFYGFHTVPKRIFFDTNKPSYVGEHAEMLNFITASLLLTRMHDVLLQKANLRKTASTDKKPLDMSIRIKRPYIGQPIDTDHKTEINIAKPRHIVPREERKVKLSEESNVWEEAKRVIRASVDDVLKRKNLSSLFSQLDAAAKELFGEDITVQIRNVRKSDPIEYRVNKDKEPYRRKEHISIHLVYEDTDPNFARIRRTAYMLIAKPTYGVEGRVELNFSAPCSL